MKLFGLPAPLPRRNHLPPQRLQPFLAFPLEKVDGFVLSGDHPFVKLKFPDRFLLYGEGWQRDLDGGHVFQADAFDDAACGEFPDFAGVNVVPEQIIKVVTEQQILYANLDLDQVRRKHPPLISDGCLSQEWAFPVPVF